IGAFIAEMDFGVAPAVRQALREIDERDLFGYAPYDLTADLKSATANFYADRFGWRIPGDHIQPASDVIAALLCVRTPHTPLHTPTPRPPPSYSPLFDDAKPTRRELIQAPLLRAETVWPLDLDALAAALVPGATLVLCIPHHPIGKVYTEAELLGLAEVVEAA